MLIPDPKITFANLPGIIVFSDGASRSAFYALAAAPRLARDEDGNPQINLTLYGKRKEGVMEPMGGFLSLTVSLGLRPEEETAVLVQLSKYLAERSDADPGTPVVPQLLAFPWLSGGVNISLGSGITASGQPSMMGDNRCSFSLKLDAEQAKAISAAWRNRLAGSMIHYHVSFGAPFATQSRTEFSSAQFIQRNDEQTTGRSRSSVESSVIRSSPVTLELRGPVELTAAEWKSRLSEIEI